MLNQHHYISKIAILGLLSLFLLASCTSTQNTINEHPVEIQKLERDDYVILDNVEGKATSVRFWLLFIPFGGKSKKRLQQKAYNKAVDSASDENADGLLQPRYTYKRIVIPLILINFTIKKMVAKGKAFRIKNEGEYQETK